MLINLFNYSTNLCFLLTNKNNDDNDNDDDEADGVEATVLL